MSSQLTIPPSERKEETRRRLPSQPVVNIGTSGHVDHGKCLAIDEYILLNGSLTTGREVLSTLAKRGSLLRKLEGGSVYELDENNVVSVDKELKVKEANSLFYCQDYSGPIYEITTATGRSISVTPDHPLLINSRGEVTWQKASQLRPGDNLAFASYIPSIFHAEFPNALEKLKGTHKVIGFEEFHRLQRITDGFNNFSSVHARDFDSLRALAGLSRLALSKVTGTDYSTLSRILEGRKSASISFLLKFATLFQTLNFQQLAPDEFILEPPGDKLGTKIRDQTMDPDLMKWFAFLWSRGTCSGGKIAVSQTVDHKLLEEFLEITNRRFGIQFEKVNDVRYELNSKALVEYLNAKFDVMSGNLKGVWRIAPWVLGLPLESKRIFVRWFLALEGEFSERVGQISIVRRNEWDAVVIAYLLQMFGIVPSFGKRLVYTKNGRVTRTRLSISGKSNLSKFALRIGFATPKIQKKLEEYLLSPKSTRRESNLTIPVDSGLIRSLLESSGVWSDSLAHRNMAPHAKGVDLHEAYSSLRTTGRISRTNLLLLLEAVESRLVLLEYSLSKLDLRNLRTHLNLCAISLDEVAQSANLTKRELIRMVNSPLEDTNELGNVVANLTRDRIEESRIRLSQAKQIANSPLEFDQIRSIRVKHYSGKIFDLTVPEYANFIAGNGAIVCHNTTIVEAITGVWTSAHSEELRRGITIKVGYADAAFYNCESCGPPECYTTDPSCPKCPGNSKLLRVVSFVDAPGHESLMANMLSGAAVMDGALLVISAAEKVPQPQTREHLLALQMLGMKHLVVVQNKVDLVTDTEASENYAAIRKFIAGTVAEDAPIIPISAQHKINIDSLIEAIEENIPTPKRDEGAKPIMQVVRSFDVNHPGLSPSQLSGGVLGGTLLKGRLSVGEEIELRPGIVEEGQTRADPILTKITTLFSSAGKAESVHPGGLIAVGTTVDPFYTRSDSLVGSVLGLQNELPEVFETLSMNVKLFDTAVGTQELVKVDKIKLTEILRLNIGTAVTVGIVSSSREAIVDAKLKKPVCASRGDRVAISKRIGDRWRLIGAGTVR